MGTYRTIDDIINEKRDYIADYEAKIAAWGNVTIKTKKDGGEFKELSNRCIDGAKMHGKGYTSGEEISVYYTGKRTYMDDSIDCYGFCDELPDGDERKIPNERYRRTQYTLTPAEMREIRPGHFVLATENEPVDADELEVEQFFEELDFDELEDGLSDDRPLTDYTVDELLSFDEPDSDDPSSDPEDNAANEIEDVSLMTDMTVEEILSTPEDQVETDMESSFESIQDESQELVAEPEAKAQSENNVETSFFEEPSREVVIPKEKQGFFARLFYS